MKKFLVFTGLLIIFFNILQIDAYAFFKSTKFTVIVIDEKGKPISGVRVGVGFEKNIGWGTNSSGKQGTTDSDGKLTFSGQSNGHITYGGKKDGYYPSYYNYDFKDLGVFGWKPWNPELKVVMRKIENPVPMYARRAAIKIPTIGKDIGFDLSAYDWVAPYGHGKIADFIFHLEKKFSSGDNYDGKLRIKFSNKGDGVLKITENLDAGSVFKLPRYAPKGNYKNNLNIETSQSPSGKWVIGFSQNDNYIFRIRTEVKNGKIIKAVYGKIRGPIKLEPRDKPTKVFFIYYLNPDFTRNLEFDPKQNLFRNLNEFQTVSKP